MHRFTISLDDGLAEQFDAWITQRGYENRSEAGRDLLRAELQKTRLRADDAPHCVACLSYVYEHQARDLAERLAKIQHARHTWWCQPCRCSSTTPNGWKPPCCAAAPHWSPRLPTRYVPSAVCTTANSTSSA